MLFPDAYSNKGGREFLLPLLHERDINMIVFTFQQINEINVLMVWNEKNVYICNNNRLNHISMGKTNITLHTYLCEYAFENKLVLKTIIL